MHVFNAPCIIIVNILIGVHSGECPKRLTSNSMSPSCSSDAQCEAYEKCCYSRKSRRASCAAAVTNRNAPRPVLRLAPRFGGQPSGGSNNFDDLFFGRTYNKSNEGWASLGNMEPL